MLDDFPFRRIRRELDKVELSDDKSRVLALAIKNGFAPGERVPVSDLAAGLNVSAYYVGTAIAILRRCGLVERRPPCLYFMKK